MILSFLNKSGDLNITNDFNETPLVYATEEMIKKLHLEDALIKVNKSK